MRVYGEEADRPLPFLGMRPWVYVFVYVYYYVHVWVYVYVGRWAWQNRAILSFVSGTYIGYKWFIHITTWTHLLTAHDA